MANVNGSAGNDVIHVAGDGSVVPAGFIDIPLATNAADVIDANAGNDIVAAGGGSDSVDGDSGNDVLGGGAGNDRLTGGAGADTLNGGEGVDYAVYTSSAARVVVTLSNPTLLGSGGDAQGDRLTGIENLAGSAFDDILSGDGGANRLEGSAGNDVLSGAGGADTLFGGAGDDRVTGGGGADRVDGGLRRDLLSFGGEAAGVTVDLAAGRGFGGSAEGDTYTGIEDVVAGNGIDMLIGTAGANTLFGADGSDVLVGGAGADRLRGGNGDDTVSYRTSALGVNVNLTLNTGGGGGDAQGDTFDSVEHVVGSAQRDFIFGNEAANRISGGAGNDNLNGGDDAAGGDVLRGESGDDFVAGFGGADLLDGGDGFDITSYVQSDQAVTIDLQAGIAAGGHAAGDQLFSIESLFGSSCADGLAGDEADNQLNGLAGNDALSGGFGADRLDGDAGTDRLAGGAGGDRFVFSDAAHTAVGTARDTILDFRRADGDRIDLSAIDANTGAAGNQAFTFIGSALFGGTAGQMRYTAGLLIADTDGDRDADLQVAVTGAPALVAGDFVL